MTNDPAINNPDDPNTINVPPVDEDEDTFGDKDNDDTFDADD